MQDFLGMEGKTRLFWFADCGLTLGPDGNLVIATVVEAIRNVVELRGVLLWFSSP